MQPWRNTGSGQRQAGLRPSLTSRPAGCCSVRTRRVRSSSPGRYSWAWARTAPEDTAKEPTTGRPSGRGGRPRRTAALGVLMGASVRSASSPSSPGRDRTARGGTRYRPPCPQTRCAHEVNGPVDEDPPEVRAAVLEEQLGAGLKPHLGAAVGQFRQLAVRQAAEQADRAKFGGAYHTGAGLLMSSAFGRPRAYPKERLEGTIGRQHYSRWSFFNCWAAARCSEGGDSRPGS